MSVHELSPVTTIVSDPNDTGDIMTSETSPESEETKPFFITPRGKNRPKASKESKATETAQRDIKTIIEEILHHKSNSERSFLEMGKLLAEVKPKIERGYWLHWLDTNIEISSVTARRYIRLSELLTDESPVTALGFTKASILLAIPKKEFKAFIEGTYDVNGTLKTIFDMTKRELEAVVREYRYQREKVLQDNISDGKEPSDSAGEDEKEIEPVEEFNNGLASLKDQMDELLGSLEMLKDDYPSDYDKLSSTLHGICESAIIRISVAEQEAAR